jgi:hypothetical protein
VRPTCEEGVPTFREVGAREQFHLLLDLPPQEVLERLGRTGAQPLRRRQDEWGASGEVHRQLARTTTRYHRVDQADPQRGIGTDNGAPKHEALGGTETDPPGQGPEQCSIRRQAHTSERRSELRIAHLYMNPPGGAIVLTFNQKSQIEAHGHTQRNLPMKQSHPETYPCHLRSLRHAQPP